MEARLWSCGEAWMSPEDGGELEDWISRCLYLLVFKSSSMPSPPQLEHHTISDLVEKAVSCIDPESEDWRVSGGDNSGVYERATHLLLDSIDVHPQDDKASRTTLEAKLRTFLNDIKTREDPGSYFVENTNELVRRIRAVDLENYELSFPLNITFDHGYSVEEFNSLGYTIEKLDRQTWIQEYLEPAQEEEDDRAHGPRDGRLTQFLDLIPDDIREYRDWTYWTFDVEARDPYFVMDRLEMVLEYLLGRINIAYHVQQPEGRTFGSRLWPTGWSDIRMPPVYLTWRDGDYYKFARGRDLAPRKAVSIPRRSPKQFEHYLDVFPSLDVPLEGVEEYFVEAVRRFQVAITEDDRSRSFLEYWRGLETLMLTQEEQPMNKVIERAAAPLAPKREELFEDRLNLAREKRNDLVHGEEDFSINRHDQNILKITLENAVFIYCHNLPDWSRSEFQTFLENAGKQENELEEEKQRLQSEMDVIHTILEDIRFEEGFFLKLFNDWMSGRNRLEDPEFVDPFGFFFPVFGVGDDEADIMVVQQAPAYPTSEDPIRLRTRVPGPRPAKHFWKSVDEYRSMCEGLVHDGNPGGIGDLLESIAGEAGTDVDSLYYTTIQKDGRFDESLDETEDGEDPEALNELSQETWLPYLEEEIDEVEPALILCTGPTATKNVIERLNPRDPVDIDDVEIGEPFWIGRYGVLRLPSLSEVNLDAEVPLDGAVGDAVDEL